MTPQAESAARAALRVARRWQSAGRKLDADVERDVLREVRLVTDKQEAKRRRNDALKQAFALLGNVGILHRNLIRFATGTWPLWRLSIPDSATPLQYALADICAASEDGNLTIPGKRQLRRIVT